MPASTSEQHKRRMDPDPEIPAPPRSATGSPPSHLHLWQLPDGTGLHAPHGTLTTEDGTGRACCHLCGRWFVHLGAHVRVHGHTAASYRSDMGLPRGLALSAVSLSDQISRRQRERYAHDDDLRSCFLAGQEMARTGELGHLAATRRAAEPLADSATAKQIAALALGRARRRHERETQLIEHIADCGFSNLSDLLATRYADGATLADLARETGLGRERLRAALDAAGVRPRARCQHGGGTSLSRPLGRRRSSASSREQRPRRLAADTSSEWLDVATARRRGRAQRTLGQLAASGRCLDDEVRCSVLHVMRGRAGTQVLPMAQTVRHQLADVLVRHPVEHLHALVARRDQPRHPESGQVLGDLAVSFADHLGQLVN